MTESDEDDSRSVLANKDAAILLEEAFNSSILRKENFYDNIIQKGKIRDEILKILKISFDFVFERKKALNTSAQITLFYDFVKVVKRTY